MSIASLQARLADAEGRAHDLAVLNAFAASLLRYDQVIDDILWDVANEVVARLELEDCVIYLFDEQRELLVQRAAHGPKNPKGREILDPIVIASGSGVVGSVAESGLAERIDDTREDPRYICDDQMRLSELAVPIFLDGEVIGVIDSEHSQLAYFTDWHQSLFVSLAALIANRIAKSRADQRLRELNQRLEDRVRERTAELEEANRSVETLLRNVLPAPIAERLRAGERRIADRIDLVAVLFADVVGFTHFAASADPGRVIALLEAFFTSFDQLTSELGAEKIKTIGDSYMVVAGVPTPMEDPLGLMAELALRMRDAVPVIRRQVSLPLEVRFGLHAGPVVAGVIGQRKFAFDLWGDTVNLAARLEASGAPSQIQVTSPTAALLEDRFIFSPPRVVDLKGLGQVETRFLTGRR